MRRFTVEQNHSQNERKKLPSFGRGEPVQDYRKSGAFLIAALLSGPRGNTYKYIRNVLAVTCEGKQQREDDKDSRRPLLSVCVPPPPIPFRPTHTHILFRHISVIPASRLRRPIRSDVSPFVLDDRPLSCCAVTLSSPCYLFRLVRLHLVSVISPRIKI